MFEKIFNRSKKKEEEEIATQPGVHFGRYSDNNKPTENVDKWNEAEALFKEKKYTESIKAFFHYLRDETEDNVQLQAADGRYTFWFYQGSKIVRGYYDDKKLQAEMILAKMPHPSVPVMRRLLEMNFQLYYSRFALDNDNIYMFFDSDIETANPSKLYYGLKELATKADKQDDLLVQDFTSLTATDIEHIQPINDEEKAVKLQYFKKWITQTIALVGTVDQDKYSGGIAYLLLALAYRIDYLIVPHGKLLLDLEKIVEVYFRKDNRLLTEKNQEMIECFTKMAAKEKEEFYPYLFRSRYTFSIVTPQNYKTISDAIFNANQNIAWYKEHKMPEIAARISEYGFSYCQYSYSLPRPISEFFLLFMKVNYQDYFHALGFTEMYYNKEKNEFNKEKIKESIDAIIARWTVKYPGLKFDTEKLRYDDNLSFNQSFTNEIEYLNVETR